MTTRLPSIILCGYERGGTTLLSDIFRNNGYESGFECGVLMCDKPNKFLNYKPYVNMLAGGWGINQSIVPSLCKGSFKEFYAALINHAFPERSLAHRFFDKTPIYMRRLGYTLNRTDFINKACVIHRDPRAIFVSWAKRVGKGKSIEETVSNNLDNFSNHYIDYFLGSVTHLNNDDVIFVPFEQLCLRPEHYLKAIGLFANCEAFSPLVGASRFENVTGSGIDIAKVFEYEDFLSQNLQKMILDKTRLASIFFSNPSDTRAYCDQWLSLKGRIKELLDNFNINSVSTFADGSYFEPETYLLLYPDVLKAKVNPVEHYINFGKKEGRRAS